MNDWMWLTGVACGVVGFLAVVVVALLEHRDQIRLHSEFNKTWGGVR